MHGIILLLLPIRKLEFIRYELNFASMVKNRCICCETDRFVRGGFLS